MGIKNEDIGVVRERADLVQIISEQVPLKKKGKYFWGCCPFHKEKTPSFKVDPTVGLYHCFGCGEGGDVFKYVMKIEHLDFADTVKAVADRIGYTLRYEGGERADARRKLDVANEDAAAYYHYVLTKMDAGKRGLDYLKQRGFTDKTIADFNLGMSPSVSWDALTKHLLKKGYEKDDLIKAGLSLEGNRGPYDRFRGRVIFPIKDVKGRTIAFGGRVLGDEMPKYLNSSETAIFKKSETLYGLYQAKGEISKEGKVLIVEGYTDVIALHQAGVKTAVATLGTAFTAEHLALLSRFAEQVILVFDSDAAGLKAAERGIAYVSEFRMPGLDSAGGLVGRGVTEVRVAILPPGLDPADMIASQGPDAFLDAVESSIDFLEFAMDRMVTRADITTPAGKMKAARNVLEVLITLDSAVAQEHYIKMLARKIGTDIDAVLLELKRAESKKGRSTGRSKPSTSRRDPQLYTEREALKIAIRHPDLRDNLALLGPERFIFPVHQRIFTVLRQIGGGTFEPGLVGDEHASYVSGLMLEEIAVEETKKEDDVSKYFADILQKLKEFGVQRQINSLRLKLEQLNPIQNSDAYDALFSELLKLEADKRALKIY